MPNFTFLVLSFLFLFLIELLYLKIADHYNIIDKPNQRSSHSQITIRGGGIIFFVAALVYWGYAMQYTYFFIGLTLVALVSFIDDIMTLPNRYRLPFQFLVIVLALIQLEVPLNNIFVWVGLTIIGVGFINAYNFMDGINGITGGYSLITLLTLWYINISQTQFIENEFLLCIIASLLVFNIFNFRKKALCFAGDIGSISIACIIFFLLIKLILIHQNPLYILLLSVYGIDSVFTIIHRLILRQNIFEAHRLHLYQILVNNLKIPHLVTSIIYIAIQAIINIFVIATQSVITISPWVSIGGVLTILGTIYVMIKTKLLKIRP
ncbi:MraY family glycosyltransferase [Flectobacillus major]|jgi:UDP-N-acetylmuramyl pentapeptide phosphotransferase/UDP-N-acetylglucosamine-1-phosphate transferase|uniref:MraY family glycosyltransferase n=1 Tax=Flectobacillus major TaxID=103 RepID=UPI00040FD457|nr:glycosyltransferase family 4 protein [Flectobacillus major]